MPGSLPPVTLAAAAGLHTLAAPAAQSEWAHIIPPGRLACKTLPAGDRSMDFSPAGYLGGGVKIPLVPVKKTVAPTSGDDTAAIQTAINQVSQMELQDGFRATVLLASGVFIAASRWRSKRATGLLVDSCKVSDSGIDLMDCGIMGSGHGWTTGWSVAWNCTAKTFVIQRPPGAMNWAIGCNGSAETSAQPGSPKGEKLPSGIFDSHGTPVAPATLYLAQLRERLGPPALANIGY